jgi:glycosyltransferase involved in cell wall biosynthesis
LNAAKVSVVVPFYNPGSFLREAIDSVFSQTYDNWELILVNDGSSDCSVDIARGFATAYPDKIRYVSHPDGENLGRSASRNLGLEHATGDFISHLDADDVYSTGKLQSQIDVFEAHPEAAMVFGKMLLWHSWSGGRDVAQRLTCPLETVLKPPRFFPFLLSGKNDPAGYLIRKAVMEEVGGYPVAFEMCEDWALYVKICLKYPVYVQSDCDYKYRQHENQTCSVARQRGTFYAQFAPFLAWLDEYTRGEGAYIRLVVWYAIGKYRALSVYEKARARIRNLVNLILGRGAGRRSLRS